MRPSSSLKSKAWTGFKKLVSKSFDFLGLKSMVLGFSVVLGFLGVSAISGFLMESHIVTSGSLIKSSDSLGMELVLVIFDFEDGVGFLALIFSARVESPSIDLFVTIIYNYNMNSTKLTKKQLAVLDFIQDFTEENGTSPSYREIMEGLGLTSVSAVAEHVDNLVSKGALRKTPGEARSLEVLDYKHTETVNLFKVKMIDALDEDKAVLVKAAEILGLDLD